MVTEKILRYAAYQKGFRSVETDYYLFKCLLQKWLRDSFDIQICIIRHIKVLGNERTNYYQWQFISDETQNTEYLIQYDSYENALANILYIKLNNLK